MKIVPTKPARNCISQGYTLSDPAALLPNSIEHAVQKQKKNKEMVQQKQNLVTECKIEGCVITPSTLLSQA
jgi:hypothetical protein